MEDKMNLRLDLNFEYNGIGTHSNRNLSETTSVKVSSNKSISHSNLHLNDTSEFKAHTSISPTLTKSSHNEQEISIQFKKINNLISQSSVGLAEDHSLIDLTDCPRQNIVKMDQRNDLQDQKQSILTSDSDDEESIELGNIYSLKFIKLLVISQWHKMQGKKQSARKSKKT